MLGQERESFCSAKAATREALHGESAIPGLVTHGAKVLGGLCRLSPGTKGSDEHQQIEEALPPHHCTDIMGMPSASTAPRQHPAVCGVRRSRDEKSDCQEGEAGKAKGSGMGSP